MKKSVLVLLALIMIATLLVGCGDKLPPILECEKEYRYTILSPGGEELYEYNQSVSIVFEHTQTDMYRSKPDGALYEEVLAEKDKLTRLAYDTLEPSLSAVFAQTPALVSWYHHWWYNGDIRISNGVHHSYIEDECASATITLQYRLGVAYSYSDTQYRTYLRYVGDEIYVKVMSPGGSFVQYSFPQRLMKQALQQALSGEHSEEPERMALTTVPLLSEQKFAEAILAASVGQAQEVASIQIATSDFEGRRELWPAVAKALELATKQHPGASFLLLAKMSTNASAAAQISYNQSDFHLTGWKSVLSGKIEGSGGGASGEGSYSYSMSQVVEATIILVPPTANP